MQLIDIAALRYYTTTDYVNKRYIEEGSHEEHLRSKRMKALCHREGLLTAFQLVSVAIPTRDVRPILKNIKAIAGEGRCTLMATDLELGIRLEVRGLNVEEPGQAILPAGRVLAILRESTDEE